MNTIVYTSKDMQTEAIPLGQDYSLRRQPGDFVLRRAVAVDLPLYVAIVITPDGNWRWWYTKPRCEQFANPYWHFANGDPQSPPTERQKITLHRMQRGDIFPFGLRGALGRPVIEWAFGVEAARIASAYHD